jgi:hypothetical protein
MKTPYFCSECHKPCEGVERDFGIGAYEFWGATGSDHNWLEVSECCDGDLLDEIPEEGDE